MDSLQFTCTVASRLLYNTCATWGGGLAVEGVICEVSKDVSCKGGSRGRAGWQLGCSVSVQVLAREVLRGHQPAAGRGGRCRLRLGRGHAHRRSLPVRGEQRAGVRQRRLQGGLRGGPVGQGSSAAAKGLVRRAGVGLAILLQADHSGVRGCDRLARSPVEVPGGQRGQSAALAGQPNMLQAAVEAVQRVLGQPGVQLACRIGCAVLRHRK